MKRRDMLTGDRRCVMCAMLVVIYIAILKVGVYSRGRGRSYGEDGDSGYCEQYRAVSMERMEIPRTLSRNRVDIQQSRNMMDMPLQQDRNMVDMAMQQGRNMMNIQDMVMTKSTCRRRNRVSTK